ncbi:type III secretion system subunit [Burkholderia ubonensis]|uniref:type III secretion system domain-containing protein n=1 Tax=Burkholderia ubonensis TaxID=101571 RepID=UPI00075AAAC3|nr:type III secretion system domain-containing protein [Burkholderia ubonensis]KVV41098.1 type III secretion system subunit [Burkholderia ubonensis]KVW14041.1 type III secretion system subunit [Burkholderia ubonensis]KVW47284.1 type III secretion system subunit [Burkholderia ubonensis]
MTVGAIVPGVSRLHALAWRPGANMHPDWWPALNLDAWQESYAYPACYASIDRLIVARRGFPRAALPARLDASQAALVALEPRLDTLMVALGLLAYGRPDYLLAQPYRTLLAAQLGEQGCAQLLALCRNRPVRGPDLAPDRLIDALRDAGTRWWSADAAVCITTRLLSTVLPPLPAALTWPAAPIDNQPSRASDWLVRMGRLL